MTVCLNMRLPISGAKMRTATIYMYKFIATTRKQIISPMELRSSDLAMRTGGRAGLELPKRGILYKAKYSLPI